MNSNGALELFLKSFEHYYNVYTKNVEAPFVAEAEFKSHSEQYLLVKSAKLADIDSNEYVFFYKHADDCANNNDSQTQAASSPLSPKILEELSKLAWERALLKVHPYYGHRNTDVTLIILSEKVCEEAFKLVKKLNFYKSYKLGFYGWSAFRLLVCETSSGRNASNRRGSDLKRIAGKLKG